MRFLLPLALIGTSGCTLFSPQWEGVWFLDIPAMDEADCDPVIGENFEDAEVPDFEFDSDWTIIDETKVSNSAFFIEVLAGKGGQVFVVIGDDVYPGTMDKNTLEVTWAGSTESLDSQEHDDGYLFSISNSSETETTLTLARGEKGQATGNLSVSTVSSIEYRETDRWRVNQVGLSYSQLPSTAYLIGDANYNLADSLECEDDDCMLTIDQACDGSIQFAASFAGKYENGMFEGIANAHQDFGANGGISIVPPSPPTTTYTYTY